MKAVQVHMKPFISSVQVLPFVQGSDWHSSISVNTTEVSSQVLLCYKSRSDTNTRTEPDTHRRTHTHRQTHTRHVIIGCHTCFT